MSDDRPDGNKRSRIAETARRGRLRPAPSVVWGSTLVGQVSTCRLRLLDGRRQVETCPTGMLDLEELPGLGDTRRGAAAFAGGDAGERDELPPAERRAGSCEL